MKHIELATGMDFADPTPRREYSRQIKPSETAKIPRKYEKQLLKNQIWYIDRPNGEDIPEKFLLYRYADEFADHVPIFKNMRAHCWVNGTFIFGDMIEALFVKHNWHTKCLTVGTLSMNDANIQSLKNLMKGGFVDELNLVVSDWFDNEREEWIPKIIDELGQDNRLQLAIASYHGKLFFFQTDEGLSIVCIGSANLRSSSCVERITLEENQCIYEQETKFHETIINAYGCIDKSLRGNDLWSIVTHEELKINRTRKNKKYNAAESEFSRV